MFSNCESDTHWKSWVPNSACTICFNIAETVSCQTTHLFLVLNLQYTAMVPLTATSQLILTMGVFSLQADTEGEYDPTTDVKCSIRKAVGKH
jgi:hypothetical protein